MVSRKAWWQPALELRRGAPGQGSSSLRVVEEGADRVLELGGVDVVPAGAEVSPLEQDLAAAAGRDGDRVELLVVPGQPPLGYHQGRSAQGADLGQGAGAAPGHDEVRDPLVVDHGVQVPEAPVQDLAVVPVDRDLVPLAADRGAEAGLEVRPGGREGVVVVVVLQPDGVDHQQRGVGGHSGQGLGQGAVDVARTHGAAGDQDQPSVGREAEPAPALVRVRPGLEIRAAHRVPGLHAPAAPEEEHGLHVVDEHQVGEQRGGLVEQPRNQVLLLDDDLRPEQGLEQEGGKHRRGGGVAPRGDDQLRTEAEEGGGGLEGA